MESATDAFIDLVGQPESDVALDRAAVLIAAHARPTLDVEAQLARLDDLARGCPEPTLDGLCRHLFDDLGFRGNREAYYEPDNSFLDQVIERRVGIPLTLSVLTLEVGRRIGVPLAAVGLPGHFLVRDKVDPTLFLDPFAAGARLRIDQVTQLFSRLHGPGARFEPAHLAPPGTFGILARLLANLRIVYQRRSDRTALVWVLRLRSAIPGVGLADREALAGVLATTGQWDAAAREHEVLALLGSEPDRHRHAAERLRARLN